MLANFDLSIGGAHLDQRTWNAGYEAPCKLIKLIETLMKKMKFGHA